MRQETRNFSIAIAFLVIGLALFGIVQEVLTPNWVWPYFDENPENCLAELSELKDSNIQAVFLGASHAEYSIDPMQIYEKSGIPTYNLCVAGEPIDLSYSVLAECFKTQSPQYVFFDANKLFTMPIHDYYYRYILDAMPMSENKVMLARSYMELFPEQKQTGAFLSAFFPIYQYHDRWEELGYYDFKLMKPGYNYFQKGYYLTNKIVPSTMTADKMNDVARIISTRGGWTEERIGDEINRTTTDRVLYAPRIDQNSVEMLLRIKALCEQNGAQLCLFKIPSCIRPQSTNAWTEVKSNMAKDVAEEYGVPFLDMLYDLEESVLDLDWTQDTCDGGGHLNYSGARKVSNWFAEYLQTECGLQGQQDAAYEADLPIYRAVCAVADLQIIPDLTTYLKRVSELQDVTVFFSAMDDMMRNMSEQTRQDLKAFGLQTDFDTLEYSDSYLAVKEGDEVLYEASGNRRLSKSGTLGNGMAYTVTSCGWRAGAESSIVIDGEEYSMNKRGINIVVLDNRSKQVLDSVAFDTWNSGSQDGVRNTSSTKKYSPMGSTVEQGYLFSYMDYLMYHGTGNDAL